MDASKIKNKKTGCPHSYFDVEFEISVPRSGGSEIILSLADFLSFPKRIFLLMTRSDKFRILCTCEQNLSKQIQSIR